MSDKKEIVLDYGRKLPLCLRKYQKRDVECNGRPRAKTKEERMSCVYRDRCVALQLLIKSRGYKARDLLKLRKIVDIDGKRRVYAFSVDDSEAFQQRLVRIIDKYGIRNGRVTIRHPSEEKSRKPRKIVNRSEASKAKSVKALVKARKEASKVIKKKAAEDLSVTKELFDWFIVRLRNAIRKHIRDSYEEAKVGELFAIDRIESSRYVTIYVKTLRLRKMGDRDSVSKKKGKKKKHYVLTRKSIVCVIFATSRRSLQFKITVDPETFNSVLSESSIDKIGLSPFDEGRFKAKTIPLGREGVSIMAEAIAKAKKKGIIKLPRVRKT